MLVSTSSVHQIGNRLVSQLVRHANFLSLKHVVLESSLHILPLQHYRLVGNWILFFVVADFTELSVAVFWEERVCSFHERKHDVTNKYRVVD